MLYLKFKFFFKYLKKQNFPGLIEKNVILESYFSYNKLRLLSNGYILSIYEYK